MNRCEVIALLCGTAAGWPLTADAQQKAMPVIGFLIGTSPGPFAPFLLALRQGLSETGYVEGQKCGDRIRWAEGRYDRLPTLVAELIGRKVDVIATVGNPPTLAAKGATSTIPIVFLTGADPVATGLIASLARPGANLTGVSILTVELMPKRLELLSELARISHTGWRS
jgi:putative ABC transport system substrate-binding protein